MRVQEAGYNERELCGESGRGGNQWGAAPVTSPQGGSHAAERPNHPGAPSTPPHRDCAPYGNLTPFHSANYRLLRLVCLVYNELISKMKRSVLFVVFVNLLLRKNTTGFGSFPADLSDL